MNIKQIRELAQIAAENGLSAIEIAEGENRVRIERAVSAPAAIPTVVYGFAAVFLLAPSIRMGLGGSGFSWLTASLMLRALQVYAAEKGAECYLSLEERMACGIGACLACVCKTKEKDSHSNVNNKRICKDGPVFLSTEVEL